MAAMIITGPPTLSAVAWISPSRFLAARACQLREAYSAERTPRLLPDSPAGKLGTVAHRLLEAAGRGDIADATRTEVERTWDILVDDADRSMLDNPIEAHLSPLSRSVGDYEVRRLRAVAAALAVATVRARYRPGLTSADGLFGTEVHVQSASGKVMGRIDEVAPSADGPIIRDYKSGVVLGEDGAALPEYATQLRLYAALYAATAGRWPSRLEIVPLSGRAVSIGWAAPECAKLVGEAEDLVDGMNSTISAADDAGAAQGMLATPAPGTCRHCPYRPACSSYLAVLKVVAPDSMVRDFVGKARRAQRLGNGRVALILETLQGEATIRGLEPNRHPVLRDLSSGSAVAVFDARLEAPPSNAAQGLATTIYRLAGSFQKYADVPNRLPNNSVDRVLG